MPAAGTLCLTFDNMGRAREIAEGTASLMRLGIRPAGFRAPGGVRGKHTTAILQSLGYRYDSSSETEADIAAADDFSVAPGMLAPGLAHIPWRHAMVDSIQYLRHPVQPRTPAELEASWLAAIDRTAEARGTITVVIHAFVSGVDEERFAVVRHVLTHARKLKLEIITAGALAERVLAQRH